MVFIDLKINVNRCKFGKRKHTSNYTTLSIFLGPTRPCKPPSRKYYYKLGTEKLWVFGDST